MIKVFYRNACSTTLISKLPMIKRIKKEAEFPREVPSCKRTFVPNSGAKGRLVSKEHILHMSKSTNINSTNRSKSSLIGTRSTTNSLRNKVPRRICWKMKMLHSMVSQTRSSFLKLRHQPRVTWRIIWSKSQWRSRKKSELIVRMNLERRKEMRRWYILVKISRLKRSWLKIRTVRPATTLL